MAPTLLDEGCFKGSSLVKCCKLLYSTHMLVDDRVIAEIVVRIGKHYSENIATRFLRPLFAQILSDTELSRRIVDLTEHSEDFVIRGFHLDDLYYNIIALARFIYLVKRDVLPNITSLAESSMKEASADVVYRTMAFSNLEPNLSLLASLLLDLYHTALEYDKKMAKGRKTVASRIPHLSEIERLLTNSTV